MRHFATQSGKSKGQYAPRFKQTPSAESPEGLARRMSVTTVVFNMDAEIAALEYRLAPSHAGGTGAGH